MADMRYVLTIAFPASTSHLAAEAMASQITVPMQFLNASREGREKYVIDLTLGAVPEPDDA